MPRRPPKTPKPGQETTPAAGKANGPPPPAAPAPAWAPPPESVVSSSEVTSPSGTTYTILHSTEKDPADEKKGRKPGATQKKGR